MKKIYYTKRDLVEILARLCEQEGTQEKFSKKYKVHRTHISEMLNGKREPPPSVVRALGFRKDVSYVRVA